MPPRAGRPFWPANKVTRGSDFPPSNSLIPPSFPPPPGGGGGAAGLVTSVGARIGVKQVDTGFHVTTPAPLELQAFLGQMVEAGMTHAVVETTSHGLAQHRVAGCEFHLGVLTNVTHEHLDYHGSYHSYLEAKARLFAGLAQSAPKPTPIEP